MIRIELKNVRRMAAQLLRVGETKIWFDPTQRERIKEVMTKEDLRALIKDGIVKKKKTNLHSRGRAKVLKKKKKRGRKKGIGKRKGSQNARASKKKKWMEGVRAQRKVLKELKQKNDKGVKKIGYGKLYKRIKGNYFKGKKQLLSFVKEKGGKR